jgi:DNA polymerase III sliding clamp (beta) subunit (PCNA family)
MKIKTLKSIRSILNPARATLPILECFYIDRDYLYFSNLEIFIRVKHHFPVKEDSQPIVVRSDHFLSRVQHIRAPYFISCNEGKITFEHGAQKTVMNCENTNDYPLKYITEEPSDENKRTEYCTISAREVSIMNTALAFIADDNLRPVMECVCLSKDYIVASDAHKLYYRKITELTKEDILFDRRAIKLMMLFPGRSYKVSKFKSNYRAESDDVTVWWRSDTQNYPNWKSVITPKEHDVTIPVKETIEAMDSIHFAVNQASGQVIFKIKGNIMELSGSNMDYDISASESVNIINSDNEIEFAFKLTFLREILKVLSDEGYAQVKMGFSDNTKSFVFEDQILLMPMMINV